MKPAAATVKAQALVLLAEGISSAKVAEKLSLHRTTLFRWMKEPGFADELAKMKKPAEAPAPRPVPAAMSAAPAAPTPPPPAVVVAPSAPPIADASAPAVLRPIAPNADEDEALALNGLRYVVADPRAKGVERVAGAKALLDHARKQKIVTGSTAPTEAAKPALETVTEVVQAMKVICGRRGPDELPFEAKTVDEVTVDDVVAVMIELKDAETGR